MYYYVSRCMLLNYVVDPEQAIKRIRLLKESLNIAFKILVIL
jgi:hypothetical protein